MAHAQPRRSGRRRARTCEEGHYLADEPRLRPGPRGGDLFRLDRRPGPPPRRANVLSAFTPRRARSRWSKRNTTLAERLAGEGRLQASGMAEVERAKADGRWAAAYPGPATARAPRRLGSCACG